MDPQAVAHKTFELNNNIESVSPFSGLDHSIHLTHSSLSLSLSLELLQVDDIFKYDKQQQQDILKQRPWKTDPHHFKKVRISAVALIKMVSSHPLTSVPSAHVVTIEYFSRSCTRDLEVSMKSWD